MRDPPADRLARAWCAHEKAFGLLANDAAAVDASFGVRVWILDLMYSASNFVENRDLFHAFGVLGRVLAQSGASPTLLAATVDGLCEVLAPVFDKTESVILTTTLHPVRAALFESYTAGCLDRMRAEALGAWEYPACAVRLDDRTVALTASIPESDGEALAAWSARVAVGCQRAGIRRAVVAGAPEPRAALADALGVIGIEVLEKWSAARRRSWLTWR